MILTEAQEQDFAASDFSISRSASLRVAVCGEQGAGKTVFLTCVFQTIRSAFTEDLVIDFDKKDVGNATYFQDIEDELIARGPIAGTLDVMLKPVRLFIRVFERRGDAEPVNLAVNLLDFAGGHFRALADLKHGAMDRDPNAARARSEVIKAVDEADAFVILINTTEIDPNADTPRRNPFSPAVDWLLGYCREYGKPVALVFSQVDRVPAFTDALMHTLPRVADFRRRFTPDFKTFTQTGSSFGIVRRLCCFETVPGDLLPRRQTRDGSIWRREPAEVVMTLVRAAVPKVRERLEKEDEARRVAHQARENEERRQKIRQWAIAAAATILTLITIIILLLVYISSEEDGQAQVVSAATGALRHAGLAGVSASHIRRLSGVLSSWSSRPERISDALCGRGQGAEHDLASALDNPRLSALPARWRELTVGGASLWWKAPPCRRPTSSERERFAARQRVLRALRAAMERARDVLDLEAALAAFRRFTVVPGEWPAARACPACDHLRAAAEYAISRIRGGPPARTLPATIGELLDVSPALQETAKGVCARRPRAADVKDVTTMYAYYTWTKTGNQLMTIVDLLSHRAGGSLCQ